MHRSCHMCFGFRDSKTAVSSSLSEEVIFVCAVLLKGMRSPFMSF